MAKYTVQTGQNIYDVALHLYGSLQGITDLLMSNRSLSITDTLKSGDILYYSDNYVVNEDIKKYFSNNNITPSNNYRRSFYNHVDSDMFMLIKLKNEISISGFAFSVSGTGILKVDWGDNSGIQEIILSGDTQKIHHTFDLKINYERPMKFYGDCHFKKLDISDNNLSKCYLTKPINIEVFHSKYNTMSLDFLRLLNSTFELNLSGSTVSSLIPVSYLPLLMKVDLTKCNISQDVVDQYLIEIAKNYGVRRDCEITLSTHPSGVYSEPQRDENLEYIITSGMEAVWVIVNEPAWNEAGKWKFIINDITYTS